MSKSVQIKRPLARVVSIEKAPNSRSSELFLRNRLVFSTNEGMHVIPFEEIDYCQSEGNYAFVYLVDGTRLLTSRTLKSLQHHFRQNSFFRTHQKFIVNIEQIRLVEADSVTIRSGQKIPVARRRRKELLALFSGIE